MNSLSQFILCSHSRRNDITEQRELLQPPLLQREMLASYTVHSKQLQICSSVWPMPFLVLRVIENVRNYIVLLLCTHVILIKDS